MPDFDNYLQTYLDLLNKGVTVENAHRTGRTR